MEKRDTASGESKTKEKESDRLRKKRCIQGESSGDKHIGQTFSLGQDIYICSFTSNSSVNALPSSIRRRSHVVTMDIYLPISGYSPA